MRFNNTIVRLYTEVKYTILIYNICSKLIIIIVIIIMAWFLPPLISAKHATGTTVAGASILETSAWRHDGWRGCLALFFAPVFLCKSHISYNQMVALLVEASDFQDILRCLGTGTSLPNSLLRMIFLFILFQRWDMWSFPRGYLMEPRKSLDFPRFWADLHVTPKDQPVFFPIKEGDVPSTKTYDGSEDQLLDFMHLLKLKKNIISGGRSDDSAAAVKISTKISIWVFP